MIELTALLLVATFAVAVSLFFTFTNGFHDASSIVATQIACGAASPRAAVINAAIFGMAGAIIGGSAVAYTIQGIVDLEVGEELIIVIAAAVLGASAWNIFTWWIGLPSSSTHALIGGLIGAAIASSGIERINWGVAELVEPPHELVGLMKVFLFLFVSILIGLAGGFAVQRGSRILLRNADRKMNRPIKRSQWIVTSLLAFSHGSNDTQKQIGLIALILFAGGYIETLGIPLWVRIACGAMMLAGTVGGGWKIMKTLGRKIFPLEPIHGLNSQISSASSILISTVAGAPISTTQVVASSVMGVGAAENAKMVQWSVGKDMLIAWLMTIPVAALLSAGTYFLLNWLYQFS